MRITIGGPESDGRITVDERGDGWVQVTVSFAIERYGIVDLPRFDEVGAEVIRVAERLLAMVQIGEGG